MPRIAHVLAQLARSQSASRIVHRHTVDPRHERQLAHDITCACTPPSLLAVSRIPPVPSRLRSSRNADLLPRHFDHRTSVSGEHLVTGETVEPERRRVELRFAVEDFLCGSPADRQGTA